MKSKLLFVLLIGALIGVSFVLNKNAGVRGEEGAISLPKPKPATFKVGKTAVVKTSKGTFSFIMYQKDMPKTTKSFIKLAKNGFYDGTVFHRYIKDFVIQGGEPKKGEPEAPDVNFEYRKGLNHKVGAVGLARADSLDSGNSQFYVTLGPAKFLDGKYAVFGQVTEGMDVVKKLRVGDKIESVRIEKTRKK